MAPGIKYVEKVHTKKEVERDLKKFEQQQRKIFSNH